jgi:Fe-S cluster assembly iron-binding protein IscA
MLRLIRRFSQVRVTDNALRKLRAVSEKDKKDYYLRIKVEAGGCHGFQYGFELTDSKKDSDV